MVNGLRTVLFTSNRPIRTTHLTRILRLSIRGVAGVLSRLTSACSRGGDNVRLVHISNGCRLYAHRTCTSSIHGLLRVGGGAPLSRTTFRILTVITCGHAIAGDFVRRIENISYSNSVTGLIRGKLVRRGNELSLPNEPLICNAASEFLHYFSLGDLSSLPSLPGSRRRSGRGSRAALFSRRGGTAVSARVLRSKSSSRR